jgi:hypothetical protein
MLLGILMVVGLFGGPLLLLASGTVPVTANWQTATHRSTGQAPDPAVVREALVQVYASRTFSWRGAFAVHTWLAAKPKDADRYLRYEVIGWNLRYGSSVVSIAETRAPDAEWYGTAPRVIQDIRGAPAETIIARLDDAARSYPYPDVYKAWPGPNSNTFVAHLGRELPELRLNLPSTAIGKDYLPDNAVFAATPSGTGYQLSLAGLFGVLLGRDEGFELNLLGLVTGIDLLHPSVKLPGLGRLPEYALRAEQPL